MLKILTKNLAKKMLWMAAGLCVGVCVSSTFAADTPRPETYRFKVLAVSAEDAAEKASSMLEGGELQGGFRIEGLIAARTPSCEESGDAYTCQTQLYYR